MATTTDRSAANPTNHRRFHLRSTDELRAASSAMGLSIPVDDDFSVLFESVPVAGRKAPNRFLVQPMEGFDADAAGTPGELAFRRYSRYAAGGFGTIWMEATAVMNAGRSNPSQFWINADNVSVFADMIGMMRRKAREAFSHEIVVIIQLTHSGRYSKPSGLPEPIIAHHSQILDPKHGLPPDYPLISDAELDRLQDTYVAAAKLAASAGVDGVDIKSCHRYLVSELLASFTREGRYGGTFENRTRLLREVAARILREAPGIFVTTRMNAFDAIPHPYGFGVSRDNPGVPDLEEPLRLAGILSGLGVPLLNVSIGNPYYNPHYGRPFDFPVFGAPLPDDHPLAGLARFFGVTRAIQKSAPLLPVVGSGYSWLRQFMPNVAAGVIRTGGATLFGIGRGAFAYPDCVRDLMTEGRMDPAKCCVTCSGCTQIMRDGGKTGCVVRDSEIYGPQYRTARRFAVDRLQAEARRCRECEEPTCVTGCPASIEIPAFLKAFADGDIATAYSILRRNNALPEMCGYVCPAEVQCEGSCVEKTFCDKPVPIRDIQLVVSRLARLKGLAGVRVPPAPTGRRVAVVGAGPAGVACAVKLLESGHHVDLFDRRTTLGGVPDELIPGQRYETAHHEVDAVLRPAIEAGRLLPCLGQRLGRDVTLPGLRSEFDAVVLAIGLSQGRSMGAIPGVYDALDFLRRSKAGAFRDVPARAAVIGGGNTAVDAALEALRIGVRDVYVLYRRSLAEMPAWPVEKEHLLASGAHLLILTQPAGYLAENDGSLRGIRIARTTLGEPDESGRRRPETVTGSESVLDVNLAVEALGQGVSDDLRDALAALKMSGAGLVETVRAGSAATSLEGVFAVGDLVNGGTTAVRGIAEGMKAAGEIDDYLGSRERKGRTHK
jgi:NADPH-dependent glutamate synthase beta subunit-like oxidoreductase/2,4-dienoyl-CoA reductase-like NADH-dependent reductase (Old Yellow Enzyme family)